MPLEPDTASSRPYDGSLCDAPCDHCGHRHCHDHTGQCLSGHPLPLVGQEAPARCLCPFPHGIQKSGAIRRLLRPAQTWSPRDLRDRVMIVVGTREPPTVPVVLAL